MSRIFTTKAEFDEFQWIAVRRMRINFVYQPLASALFGSGVAWIVAGRFSVIPWMGLLGCVLGCVGCVLLLVFLWEKHRDYARAKTLVINALEKGTTCTASS